MNKPSTPAPASVTVAFWLVIVITAAWILPGLVGHDPWKPDEAYTFGVVYDFLQSGLHANAWVVPTLAQEPFLDRPPLYALVAAALSWLLSWGLSAHDAARLLTGICMALTFSFIGLAAREWYGRGYGRLAALTLLGCFGLVLRCHQLIADVALLTGFALAFYGLALAPRRSLLGGLWFGTGVGLAFMTRGVLPPIIFLIVALSLPLFPAWRTKRYFVVMAIALAAAAPWLLIWPLALYFKSPALFHTWLWDENLNDLITANRVSDSLYYLSLLPWYGLPALPLALWTLWRLRKRLNEARVGIPLLTFALLLAALSFSSEQHELYALPLLLPLTLLATPASDTLRRGAANLIYWFSMMSTGVFILVAWFYWIALDLGWPDRLHAHLLDLLPNYTPAFHVWPVLLAALYTVAWVAVLISLKRDPRRPIVAWAASATVMWGLAALLFSSAIDSSKSYRQLAVNLKQALPAQYSCIASRGLGDSQSGMLEYFAGIVTYREENPEREKQASNCNWLLVQGTIRTAELPPGTWRRTWESGRPGDKLERYRLYQRVR